MQRGARRRLFVILRPGLCWAAALLLLANGGPWSLALAAHSTAAGVTLQASLPSGQPVGTRITWTATATGMENPVYRFSVSSGAGPVHVLRDFSPVPSFTWAPLQEDAYTMQVTAKDGFTSTGTVQAATAFTINSRLTGNSAVVSATANPLVALYSAPACTGTLTVQFRPATGSAAWQSMPAQACSAGKSVNVLVAGMRAATQYDLQSVVANGGTHTTSGLLAFTTGRPEAGMQITTFTVKQPPTAQADTSTPFIFHALDPSASPAFANPIITDRAGNLVWYFDTPHSGLTTITPTRMLTNTVLILGNDGYHPGADDMVAEVDLAGNPVRETTIDAVNAQLVAHGQEPITMFDHEALRLPDGDTAVLGATNKMFGDHNVQSDMVVVLDSNFQVVWNWDMFAHFTPSAAWLATQPTCPTTGAPCSALDWSHGNALDWSATDSDLIVSFRYLSMVIKINYQNGQGDGSVLWQLGQGGTFTLKTSPVAGASPWFDYQHNPTYVNGTSLVVFDDGDLRCQDGKVTGCQSRGQEYVLDEQHHTATLVFSVNLGAYWQALGSTQQLPNGNLTFAGGYPAPAKEEEFSPNGVEVYELDTDVPVYRAYWLSML